MFSMFGRTPVPHKEGGPTGHRMSDNSDSFTVSGLWGLFIACYDI